MKPGHFNTSALRRSSGDDDAGAQRRPAMVRALIRHSRTDAQPASETGQPYRRVIGPTIAPRKPSSH